MRSSARQRAWNGEGRRAGRPRGRPKNDDREDGGVDSDLMPDIIDELPDYDGFDLGAEIRRMGISSGGAAVARQRGIDRR